MNRPTLKAGDMISFSSGSHSRGPYGFRVVGKKSSLFDMIQLHSPYLLEGFQNRLPLIINAYPATIGFFDFGVCVDTFLSLSTASRALHLASLENMPVVLIGQPLYLADVIVRHLKANPALPDTILIITGGYVMPNSLEKTIRQILSGVKTLNFLHGYGVAEVDAACLLATRRNEKGELIYYTRDKGVEVTLNNERLLLSIKNGDETYRIKDFDSEDYGSECEGGYVIWNHDRLHPHVGKILGSWTVEDWIRRTGYLYFGRELRFQLRKGYEPKSAIEAEFHDYEKKYGHYWLFKPVWNKAKDANRENVLRKTII